MSRALQGLKKDIFREPWRGLGRSTGVRFGSLQVLVGRVIVTPYLLLGPSQNVRPFYVSFEVLLGLTFVPQGVAELLPVDRRRLAGGPRFVSVVLALLAILAVPRFPG